MWLMLTHNVIAPFIPLIDWNNWALAYFEGAFALYDYCNISSVSDFLIPFSYSLDISEDKIKVAKIAHHYTKFNLWYKNLKTNQNPEIFYYKNSSVSIFPNDAIYQKNHKIWEKIWFLKYENDI